METILIVEDDEGVGYLQGHSLQRGGFDVVVVNSLENALEALRNHQFDLAFLDFRLPGMGTGLDLYERIKALGYDLPVIFVTGFSDEQTIIQALRAGASDFVTKSSEYLAYLPEAAERVLRQRRLERQLEDSQARFRSFIDNGPAIILMKDAEGRISYANKRYEEIFPNFDWRNKSEEEVLPGDRGQELKDGDQTAITSGCLTQRVAGVAMPNGQSGHWLTYTFPIEGTMNSSLTGIVAVDVTDRTLAEEALRDSEAKFRSVADSAIDAVIATDAQRRIISWNKGAQKIFGYAEADILGASLTRLFVDAEQIQKLVDRDNASFYDPHNDLIELVGVRKEGEEFPLEMSVGTWQTGENHFYSVILRDTTERKRAEEALRQSDAQLRQAQKMEAIGTLAGGVAHEFNNLLQAIQGYTHYAIEGLSDDDERRQDLVQVLKASERATTLTRHLLGFSRREVLQLTDLDPNAQVQDLVKMLRPLIGENIEIELNLAENVGKVHADVGHLQQLLMNLCVNARDAMPQGGMLLIKTENLILTENDEDLCRDLELGRYLVLSVADTGCGISPQHKERIFEPFFTTKGIGKGTGLGLPMVYGVVRQHQGTIRVDSEVGMGTTFRIYLPTIDHLVKQDESESRQQTLGGHETILVAEDDPMVRDVAVRILNRAGYQTITAVDGQHALDLFEENREDIALAVLDVVMPRLGGREVYQKIKASKPEMQVVFCSGYDPAMAGLDCTMEKSLRIVQKPFDAEKLLTIIRDALDHELCLAN
jgi:PAS domain S-box-containing protein